jgi:hypothetical protein
MFNYNDFHYHPCADFHYKTPSLPAQGHGDEIGTTDAYDFHVPPE